MSSESTPIRLKALLYTFRRCPYAIRARLAINISALDVEFHEVALRNKPAELLALSPKGTVPVLQLPDGAVLEQSLDIMCWALSQNDPQHWLRTDTDKTAQLFRLIETNDNEFKYYLDRYKYADRYPEYSALHYRTEGERFLSLLNAHLAEHTYLLDERVSLADMAILPFIRQFAHVDRDWFYASSYRQLIRWLTDLLNSALFSAVMQK
jgi:glutathione S-transferase